MLVLRLWEREPERFCHDYLLNLLISRLSASLCMVFGSCCISLKMKSWREDSYCVDKKYIYWLFHFFCCFFTNGHFSGGNSNSIHPPRLRVPRTAKTRIIPRRLGAKTARRATRPGSLWPRWVDSPQINREKKTGVKENL